MHTSRMTTASMLAVLSCTLTPLVAIAQAPATGGLKATYYDNSNFTGRSVSRVDGTVGFDWGTGSPEPSIGADTFSVRWTGQVVPRYGETYTFSTKSDDGVRLWVDGRLLVDNWTSHALVENTGTIALVAGRKYTVKMEYYDNAGGATAQLLWASASQAKEVVPRTQLLPATENDTIRLLEQATFGPTDADITTAQSMGITAWVDDQLAKPATDYPDYPYYPSEAPADCVYDGNSASASSRCNRDNYSLFQVQLRFFQNAMTGGDQLRQRTAFALGQIFVVSGNEINQAYAMGEYQQILNRDALGNFRQLLSDVTLNPAMGRYLDMVNNDKASGSYKPNENYAREVLQLFTVGKVKLNADGTSQLDGVGQPIPTYGQAEIENFARVFTGWTYPTLPGATPRFYNPEYYIGPMESISTRHDVALKTLLNGQVLPAGQTAQKDLDDAIDNIFNHPNVGPFVSKLLIQHLVTSNPTPGYVSRISAVFNNNGSGVRGDLKAVVRAIILDSEARGDLRAEADYGHLREPVLLMTGVIRANGGQTDGVYPKNQSPSMSQNLFYSPSVFNYYSPSTKAPNTNIYGPEFDVLTSTTVMARSNFVNSIVYSSPIAPDPNVTGATGTSINLSALQAVAADPQALCDKLNRIMLHGTMSAGMRNAIVQAVTAVPAADTIGRARCALYLVATSPQYQVER